MKFIYPAMTFGIPPGYRVPRQTVLMRELDFAMTDVSGGDAPVAVRIQDKVEIALSSAVAYIDYRSFEGQLYRRSAHGVEDLADRDPLVSRSPPLDAVIAQFNDAVTRNTWPVGLWDDGARCSLSPDMASDFAKSHLVVLDSDGQALLDECERFAVEQLSRYILVDGEMWEAAPDPAFCLDPGRGIISGYSVDPQRDVRSLVSRNLGDVYLPFNDAALQRTPQRSVFPKVRVHMPEALVSDFRHENQRLLAYTLETSFQSRRGDLDLRVMLADLVAVADGRKGDGSPAALDLAVADFLEACGAFERATGHQLFPSWANETIRFHREMWDNRAIPISSIIPCVGL